MVGKLQQRLQEIRAHLQAGHPELVLEAARALLEHCPQYPTAYLLLAEVYQALQRWQEAAEVLHAARQRFPRHRVFEQRYQQLQRQRGTPDELPQTPSAAEPAHPPGESEPDRHLRRVSVPLRLIEGAGEATVRLRSTLVRLIPGLEFAPLRSEPSAGSAYRGLPPPPPFPAELEAILREAERTPPPEPLTPLEELARRLEHARIPAPERAEPAQPEAPVPEEPMPSAELPIVTETMARIYEQQGAYELALRIYEELARRYPERRAAYDHAQARLRERLGHAGS